MCGGKKDGQVSSSTAVEAVSEDGMSNTPKGKAPMTEKDKNDVSALFYF